MIKRLRSRKLIDEYVLKAKTRKDDEKMLDIFLQKIYDNDINLNKDIVKRLIAEVRNQNKMPEKYDLEFDNQLIRALETLKIQKIYKK